MSHYIVFKLDQKEYWVEMNDIQEIALYSAIEKSNQSAQHVSGIFETQTAVIPVYQLRERSCLNYFKRREKQILIVMVEGRQVGLVIDEVFHVDERIHREIKINLLDLVSGNRANLFGYGKFKESHFVLLNGTDMLMYEKSRRLA